MGRISVVVPNWNGAGRLARLLESLQNQTEKACEVLVVDNASSDESYQTTHARQATWIALDRNYGFARAVNTGIRQAFGEAIAILNNDVTIAPDFLERLGGALEHHAFVAPKILVASDPTRLDGTFDLTSRGFCSWRAGHGFASDSPALTMPRMIASAPLTAAVFRRSVFDQVGLLDEQFGSYLEDVDFGIRCALSGVTGFYTPTATAWHEGSATLGGAWNARSVQWIARNQVLLSKKYGSPWSWPVLVGQGLWGLSALQQGAAGAWFQGKIEGYRLQGQTSGAMLSGADQERLNSILRTQEHEIHGLLAESGTNQWYWSAYLALTGGPK